MHNFKTVLTALLLVASPAFANSRCFDADKPCPTAKHPQIFQSTYCVAQWVDLPGPRVWFTGKIKNTGPDGAECPIFKVGNKSVWWGDPSWSLAGAALNQLQKSCPEVEVAG